MFVIMVLAQAELFRRTFYQPSVASIFFACSTLVLANYLGSSADYAPLEVREASVSTMAGLFWLMITIGKEMEINAKTIILKKNNKRGD